MSRPTRLIKMQAELVREPTTEFSPLDVFVKLDPETISKFTKLLRPKQEEMTVMLKQLMERKKWSKIVASHFLNISEQTVKRILNGKFPRDGAIVRLIWLLCQVDECPDYLGNPLHYVTWGKSKGLLPRKDRVLGVPRIKKVKAPWPTILKPTSPYLYVDWSMLNSEIATLLNVSEQTVKVSRRKLRKFPRLWLIKAFGAVQRSRQVNILVRGVVRSLSEKIAEALGPDRVKPDGIPKLDIEKVIAIRSRHAAGETQSSLAVEYGVCRETIKGVVKRKSWKNVATRQLGQPANISQTEIMRQTNLERAE